MMQLIDVFRARCTDHSDPLGIPHSLIFIDSDHELANEYGGFEGCLYRVKLAYGTLDRESINKCFDVAEEKKKNGDIWRPAGKGIL